MPWGYAAAAVGTVVAGGMGADAAGDAADTQAASQREALEYQKMVEALPLDIRNQFLPMLANYYKGGEGQQQIIDQVTDSPMYDQMVKSGQEGVLSNAGAMGLSRSGNTARDLSQSNQGVLNNLVQQRLSGIAGLAQQPLNTNAIASQMSGIGQTQAQGQMGAANAYQQAAGGLFGILNQGVQNNWGQSQSPPPTNNLA